MIEVRSLTKRYGDFTAVDKVSFSAERGEIVGFLGPNGAGKTTTLRMLITYLPPTSGTAEVAGHDILKEPNLVRKNIGYLPENPPLYGDLTVTEFLRFMASIKQVPAREIKGAVERVIEQCFIGDVRRKLCSHLSKGYRQRVGLAQAIISDPEVVILDEPTSGLDPKQIIDIRKLISSLAENHTVILSTHILQEVIQICTMAVIIVDGRIAVKGRLDEIVSGTSLEQVFVDCVSGDKKTGTESE